VAKLAAGFNQISYQNDFIKKNYDRINLTVPKGKKEVIKKRADSLGKSVNEYINQLIDSDMQSNV
jgi:predicted DNA binding CopG/RHH family protein